MTATAGLEPIAVPPARGGLGLVQGVYGDRGNLELVYPDPDDGIWVCWRNHDRTAVGGVDPGGWSGGLRFADGRRYDVAAIAQLRRGPDFLEVFAAAGPELHRWTWSPHPGFQRTDVLSADGAAGPLCDVAIAETRRGLVVAARQGDEIRVWGADATTYPALPWSRPEPLAVLPHAAAVGLRPDEGARVWSAALLHDDRLAVCSDLAEGEWREVRLSEVSAVAAVAPTRGAGVPGETAYVVAAAGELVGLDVDGRRTSAAVIGGPVDALAAGACAVDGGSRVDVMVRRGSALAHAVL